MPKMTRAAFLNAFLCPGLGHWSAGWRVTGAILATLAVLSAGSPLAAFVWGVASRPYCFEGSWACTKSLLWSGWSWTWPPLLVGVPTFLCVYVGALAHGMTLQTPADRSAQTQG